MVSKAKLRFYTHWRHIQATWTKSGSMPFLTQYLRMCIERKGADEEKAVQEKISPSQQDTSFLNYFINNTNHNSHILPS